MIGKRVRGLEPHEFQPGEYGRFLRDANNWYAQTPNDHCANLSGHNIIEHEDGTITVSPSILVSTRRQGVEVELWHGFLDRGVWRQAN